MIQSNLKIRAIQSAVAATLAATITTGFAATAVSAANEFETSHTEWTDHDVRITEIGLLLFNDQDRDGYFTRFSMTIDAETRYHDERVYAAIDLIDSAFNTEVLHVTDDFSLYSNIASDDYQVDLDLVRNYSTDRYNLKVSLHSAIDNRLLDDVSAANKSNLRGVPLESEDLDRLTYNDGPTEPGSDFSNTDIRVNEYAGNASFLLIAGVFLTLFVRLLSRRMDGATTLLPHFADATLQLCMILRTKSGKNRLLSTIVDRLAWFSKLVLQPQTAALTTQRSLARHDITPLRRRIQTITCRSIRLLAGQSTECSLAQQTCHWR